MTGLSNWRRNSETSHGLSALEPFNERDALWVKVQLIAVCSHDSRGKAHGFSQPDCSDKRLPLWGYTRTSHSLPLMEQWITSGFWSRTVKNLCLEISGRSGGVWAFNLLTFKPPWDSHRTCMNLFFHRLPTWPHIAFVFWSAFTKKPYLLDLYILTW